jgi:hypothetical protein
LEEARVTARGLQSVVYRVLRMFINRNGQRKLLAHAAIANAKCLAGKSPCLNEYGSARIRELPQPCGRENSDLTFRGVGSSDNSAILDDKAESRKPRSTS